MTVIGLASAKGSPGVTTLAIALAARARAAGAVLIEADPAGGDLALRFAISQTPGLAQLAARIQRTGESPWEAPQKATPHVLADLSHPLAAPGLDLVPAPLEPEAAAAALDTLAAATELLRAAAHGRPVLLDLGRIDAHGPSRELAGACDTLGLVVRGDAVSLGHARYALQSAAQRTGFVLIDTGPYRAAEAEDVLGVPCLATIPYTQTPLRGRRSAKALRTLWNALTTPATDPAPEHAADPQLTEVAR